jgi:hypothetical protein
VTAGCSEAPLHEHEHEQGEVEVSTEEISSMTVEDAVSRSCSTSIVRGLSEQLIDEINCLRPGTMRSIEGIPGVTLGSAVMPYLQAPAADALRRAAGRAGSIYVNSATRTLAQQYLLWRWGQRRACGISAVAFPGTSNHETGQAVDIEDPYGRMSSMRNSGWTWIGSFDPVHFDYFGSGTIDLSGLSVRAFQRLWNRNNPSDRVEEDGSYGDATASRLRRAPASGFARGASCNSGGSMGEPSTMIPSFAVQWQRREDGSYRFTSDAPSAVRRVEYRVDDFVIGSPERSAANDFAASYSFSVESNARRLVARGLDSAGNEVARSVGLLDVTEGTAVFIRPLGNRTYEIGLERAPSAVGAIEVRVDGFLLTDAVSNSSRSTRLAVRSAFTTLGERNFVIDTLNANGTYRGTLRRTLTLR